MARMMTARNTDNPVLNILLLFLKEEWDNAAWRDDVPEPGLYLRQFGLSGSYYSPCDDRMSLALQVPDMWGAALWERSLTLHVITPPDQLFADMLDWIEESVRYLCRVARKREEHGLEPW